YNPRNILIDARSEPARISPVDWEMAAVGSALYDLAYLAYGFEPPSLDRLIDAYRDEARAQDVALPDREQMRQVLDSFRLGRLLRRGGPDRPARQRRGVPGLPQEFRPLGSPQGRAEAAARARGPGVPGAAGGGGPGDGRLLRVCPGRGPRAALAPAGVRGR